MTPSADLFLAASDLERQLHIHRPGRQPLEVEASLSGLTAALLLLLVAVGIAVATFVEAPAATPAPAPAPGATSVRTDPSAPARVIHLELDPIR